MLLAALLMGALTAYYYGLRYGLWAAAATYALLIAAFFLPPVRLPAYIALGAACLAIQWLGARRPRPPSTVLAVRWVMGRARDLRDLLGRPDSDR